MPDEGPRPEENTKNPAMEETRTSIDALLELLRTKGKSELNNVAITLNIDPRIIENWAKVLESGGLIRISYEVGKMYLEPVTVSGEAQTTMQSKTELTKFILEEDLAVERISLDKFSKNIDQLNVTIGEIEKAYQQKMPDVHRMLSDIDKAYAPIEEKRRGIDKLKEDANANYAEINKKITDLSTKLQSFSPRKTEDDISDKMAKLNSLLNNIDDAQNVILQLETDETKFFDSLQIDIDARVHEMKNKLEKSRATTDQNVKANARQLNELVKSIKDQAALGSTIAKEVDSFRKDFEASKRSLDTLNIKFADRYQKIMDGIEKDRKVLDAQSKLVEEAIKAIKQNMGTVSKLDEQIRLWKKNVADITREITLTRTEILKLTNQLNMLDSKTLSVEKKGKMIEDIKKEGKENKERVGKIKKSIQDTADDIRKRAEESA